MPLLRLHLTARSSSLGKCAGSLLGTAGTTSVWASVRLPVLHPSQPPPLMCHHIMYPMFAIMLPPLQQSSPHRGSSHCLGATFTVGDTWDLSDVVTQSPQPAWGIPCSNIFLELSRVCTLIRNTRIPGTVKTEGCGDSWVHFTF